MDSYAELNATRKAAVDQHNAAFAAGRATNRLVLQSTGIVADDQSVLLEAAPEPESVPGGRYIRRFGAVGRESSVLVNGNGEVLAGTMPATARDAVPAAPDVAPGDDDAADDGPLPGHAAAVSLLDDAVSARPAPAPSGAPKRGRG